MYMQTEEEAPKSRHCMKSPVNGNQDAAWSNAEVRFVQGYERSEKNDMTDTNWQETSLENGGGSTAQFRESEEMSDRRAALRKEAVQLAKE